jgi:hypothetical protein
VWHAVQELLAERSRVPIRLPSWFEFVAKKVWTGDVRIRRYFPAFIEACKTVCLIRSFRNDERNPKSLQVTFRDYAIATLIFADAFSKSLTSIDERNMELRECILRISSNKGGHPVSAQEVASELSIPLHEAYERIRRAAKQKLVRRANLPKRGNKKLFRATEAGNAFLPDPKYVFKEVMGNGRRLKFVHPLTGEALIFKS